MTDRQSACVKILRGERPVGNGFLAKGRRIVTCAHVVAEATGVDARRDNAPEAAVAVQFHWLGNRPCVHARVDPAGWRPVGDREDGVSDIAMLRLPEVDFDLPDPFYLAREDREDTPVQFQPFVPSAGRTRRITALLRQAGWAVNAQRVERIWRREGLKVPRKQPKKGRLWLNDGSCLRLRPERANHVWAYDFVEERTHDGRKFRMLCVVDEFTRECLAIRVKRELSSSDVLEVLADCCATWGLRSRPWPRQPTAS